MPLWGPASPRAFRFPVHQPYSNLYIALKDEQVGGDDVDIGRVTIELGSLVSGTVYDAWFSLQLKNLQRTHHHQRGSVRLR